MISLEQWRSAIGSFASHRLRQNRLGDVVSYESLSIIIVCAGIVIGLLLIMSGNVELSPGPFKKCPKCENFVATRTGNCKCGHVFIKCRQHNVTDSKRVAMRIKRACESKRYC